jgi:hypothetical protein
MEFPSELVPQEFYPIAPTTPFVVVKTNLRKSVLLVPAKLWSNDQDQLLSLDRFSNPAYL